MFGLCFDPWGQNLMASKRVTIFGGSGFLGRQIVKYLAAEGTNVRVAVRHPERASSPTLFGTPWRPYCPASLIRP